MNKVMQILVHAPCSLGMSPNPLQGIPNCPFPISISSLPDSKKKSSECIIPFSALVLLQVLYTPKIIFSLALFLNAM